MVETNRKTVTTDKIVKNTSLWFQSQKLLSLSISSKRSPVYKTILGTEYQQFSKNSI